MASCVDFSMISLPGRVNYVIYLLLKQACAAAFWDMLLEFCLLIDKEDNSDMEGVGAVYIY